MTFCPMSYDVLLMNKKQDYPVYFFQLNLPDLLKYRFNPPLTVLTR